MSLDILPTEMRQGAEAFIDKYKPNLTVDNFHSRGIKFTDDLDQTVVVVPAKSHGGYLLFTKAHADIFVILEEDIMIGWVHVSSLIDAGEEYMVPPSALSRMPRKMKFAQECPHLGFFGGFNFSGKYITCFGCGKEIV